jgi:hypothetical protein
MDLIAYTPAFLKWQIASRYSRNHKRFPPTSSSPGLCPSASDLQSQTSII